MRELDHWVIHGVKIHHRIHGFFMIMECQSNVGDHAPVGVTVDIVPINSPKPKQGLTQTPVNSCGIPCKNILREEIYID